MLAGLIRYRGLILNLSALLGSSYLLFTAGIFICNSKALSTTDIISNSQRYYLDVNQYFFERLSRYKSVFHLRRDDVIAQLCHAKSLAKKLYPYARMVELPGGHLVSHERTEEV